MKIRPHAQLGSERAGSPVTFVRSVAAAVLTASTPSGSGR